MYVLFPLNLSYSALNSFHIPYMNAHRARLEWTSWESGHRNLIGFTFHSMVLIAHTKWIMHFYRFVPAQFGMYSYKVYLKIIKWNFNLRTRESFWSFAKPYGQWGLMAEPNVYNTEPKAQHRNYYYFAIHVGQTLQADWNKPIKLQKQQPRRRRRLLKTIFSPSFSFLRTFSHETTARLIPFKWTKQLQRCQCQSHIAYMCDKHIF